MVELPPTDPPFGGAVVYGLRRAVLREIESVQDNVGGPPWMPGVTATPRPTRYVRQSQAISPWRDTDPKSR